MSNISKVSGNIDVLILNVKTEGVTNVFKTAKSLGLQITRQTIYNFTWGKPTTSAKIEIIEKAYNARKELSEEARSTTTQVAKK